MVSGVMSLETGRVDETVADRIRVRCGRRDRVALGAPRLAGRPTMHPLLIAPAQGPANPLFALDELAPADYAAPRRPGLRGTGDHTHPFATRSLITTHTCPAGFGCGSVIKSGVKTWCSTRSLPWC